MFYYVRGELAVLEPGTAVVDCAGVGYKLLISDNTLGKLANMDKKEVLLYTYMYVREDAVDLIGFASKEELSAFKMLISVSGVGPKAAMSILSLLTVEKFALAVSTQDSKAIAKASGIGPKTAARIVLELKEKVAKEFAAVPAGITEQELFKEEISMSGNLAEAEKALMVLGYTKAEAQTALKGVPPTASLEEMVSAALRKMALRF
ncbi:MAG: Holliday junction branch migration protein RuvA [Clostridia bacterium]|nr:Holliday junction branch migration protein RuvA [Clostridia bacterium]